MKVLVVFALVVLAVYTVDACRTHGDCNAFGSSCATNHYACVFTHCHCLMGSTGGSCSNSGDCPDCQERLLAKHCIDGSCHCTLNLGGIGGLGGLGGVGK